jgi:hypothetical protein
MRLIGITVNPTYRSVEWIACIEGANGGLATFVENQCSCNLFVVIRTKIDRIPLQSLFWRVSLQRKYVQHVRREVTTMFSQPI